MQTATDDTCVRLLHRPADPKAGGYATGSAVLASRSARYPPLRRSLTYIVPNTAMRVRC